MAMEKAARLREEGKGAQPAAPEQPNQPASNRPVPGAVHTAPPVAARALAPKNPFLVNLLEPHSVAAEEYRKLKSALVKLTEGETFKNTIMVSSAVSGEGKSLTALNLALCLAQGLDHTVLLIDADLRRPSLHRYLDLEQGPGLAEVLMDEAEIGETLVATGLGKLSVIRAGRQVDNPTELFSSLKMKGLVEELKLRYPDRYVIFDTPPLLPFAESRSLARLVDGVLFVVMERLASQAEVKDALDAIKGSALLGVVYNAACVNSADEHYYYYRNKGGANG